MVVRLPDNLVRFPCPNPQCKRRLKATPSLKDRQTTCPACGEHFVVKGTPLALASAPLPSRKLRGFALRQLGFHREIGLRQIKSALEVQNFGH